MPITLSCVLALGLGACASTTERYPSLAKRESERYYGTLQPVSPEPAPVQNEMPDAELSQSLANLQREASDAHGQFLADLPSVRTEVETQAGTAQGSDGWFAAQTAISGLDSYRARTMIALAELDRLYIAAQLDRGARDAIGAAQHTVETMVQAENVEIAGLLGRIGE